MKLRHLIYTLTLSALPLCSRGQNAEAEKLFAQFKAAARFDYNFPREKVYLHTDNTAYIENDTLWYKAYVVRASSLRPTQLSRVLYVELLNADGQLMEKQTLQLDSLGQADGCFRLNLPIRAGYYEIRAYTRSMTNWGETACFSRVIPVFTTENPNRKERTSTAELEELSIPEPKANRKVSISTPRPYLLNRETEATFYPEGGTAAKGVAQRMAFKLTDGRGNGLDDTLHIYTADGQRVTEAVTEHEGMGTFCLPADFTKGYAVIAGENQKKGRRFTLPEGKSPLSLRADRTGEGVAVSIAANDSLAARHELFGLAVFNREMPCFFDTLTATSGMVEILIPNASLREGVNRIELFAADGRSLASRLVWQPVGKNKLRHVKVELQQNAATYGPFEPAVLKVKLTDAQGRPVKTTFSVAVSDEDGQIVEGHDAGMATDLLFSSELRGYIHRPAQYFVKSDAVHLRMTDLLLMVQGWRANSFEEMCGSTPFTPEQPIEDRLILRGKLLKDNNRKEPLTGFFIDFKAYSLGGGSLEGVTQTDGKGNFAFRSNINFTGNYIGQFTSKNEEGKRKWARLTLDRWFAPAPRPFAAAELQLTPASKKTATDGTAACPTQIFEWKDTIPHTLPSLLGEANVKVKGKYRGFTGNRYTWNGGEKTGMSRATKYYNIQQEVERLKDTGRPVPELFELLSYMESDFEHSRYGETGNGFITLQTAPAEAKGATEPSVSAIDRARAEDEATDDDLLNAQLAYKGRTMRIYIDNEPLETMQQRYKELYGTLEAENIKSVAIVTDNQMKDAVSGKQKRFSRNTYAMYIYSLPDAFRFKQERGIERRHIEGFTPHVSYYAPDYRRFDLPSEHDLRRTLHWAPSVKTNDEGETHLIFFTNARSEQKPGITVRGITAEGMIIDADR